MTEQKEKYKKKLKINETHFAAALNKIEALQVEYDTVVEKRNLITEALRRVDYNQWDKQIIEFHKSVSAYGISDGEWKLIIKRGLEDLIYHLDKQLCRIGDELSAIIK